MSMETVCGTEQSEWQGWSSNGRAGAKLCLGPVFLGEVSYPHDFGLGARWKAWLNHEHLGFFPDEAAARARIEAEIVKRMRLLLPAWQEFQRRRKPSLSLASDRAAADAA